MSRPLGERASRRLREGFERALLRVLGRELRCAECGRPLFRGLALVWGGEVWLVGTTGHNVRVAFSTQSRLELRHVELDQCPSPDRPWVA